MIYLFYGNDTKNKRKAYDAFAKSLAKVPAFTFIKNDFNREQVQSFFSGAGLFFDTCAIFFENVFDRYDSEKQRSPNKMVIDNDEIASLSQNPLDYFYPKHSFTRDSSKLSQQALVESSNK